MLGGRLAHTHTTHIRAHTRARTAAHTHAHLVTERLDLAQRRRKAGVASEHHLVASDVGHQFNVVGMSTISARLKRMQVLPVFPIITFSADLSSSLRALKKFS